MAAPGTPEPPELDALVVAMCRQWLQAHPRRWAHLRWLVKGAATPVLPPPRLAGELLAGLDRLEAGFARHRQRATITLCIWQEAEGVCLEMRADQVLAQEWRFPRQPLLGPAPRRQRGRLVLPAQPQSPHLRCGVANGMCVVSPQPATVELARSLLAPLGLPGMWAATSLRRARRWLVQHPRCPLLLVEDVVQGQSRISLTQPTTGLSAYLAPPYTAGELLAAARKIYCQHEEIVALRAESPTTMQASLAFS